MFDQKAESVKVKYVKVMIAITVTSNSSNELCGLILLIKARPLDSNDFI